MIIFSSSCTANEGQNGTRGQDDLRLQLLSEKDWDHVSNKELLGNRETDLLGVARNSNAMECASRDLLDKDRLGDCEVISPAAAKNSHLTEYASKELLGRECRGMPGEAASACFFLQTFPALIVCL